MSRILTCLFLATVSLASGASGCSRNEPSVTTAEALPKKSPAPCTHAACGDGYFVDVVPAPCKAKEPCGVDVRVEATGAFHINDEYPYKLTAEAAPTGVAYRGSDATNPSTFSKASGDWKKTGEKTGAMKATLVAEAPGSVAFGGTLKLSVCSAATCLLDQPHIASAVAVQ